MNYAFTSNMREVIKFYNLGNKSFETDYNYTGKMFRLHNMCQLCRSNRDSMESDTFYGDFMLN